VLGPVIPIFGQWLQEDQQRPKRQAPHCWHTAGRWKRIMVVDEAIPHDFPDPHTDQLYQAIE